MDRACLAFLVRVEVVEGSLQLGEATGWMCRAPIKKGLSLDSSPLSPSCTFGDMGYAGTVTMRRVWGYGPQVHRALGQMYQVGVGSTSDRGQSEQMAPGGHCRWKRGPRVARSSDSPEKLAVWHSSGFKILDPSRCTYLHIPVLSGASFTYHSQMCKSGVSGLMDSDSSNIF